jgi:alkylated DNA repair dioxygenase AlkB
MDTLFPLEKTTPAGFQYIPDFISIDEEAALIRSISDIQLNTFIFQGYEAKRRVASFGYDWNFDDRKLSKGRDIPEELNFLISKVGVFLGLRNEAFAEVLLTEYPVDSVINWHRDAPPFDLIAGISLLSDCTFRFRPHDKEKQGKNSVISIPVSRRSLYVIQGPGRTDWQHSILPVKQKRYSITLRTLREGSL